MLHSTFIHTLLHWINQFLQLCLGPGRLAFWVKGRKHKTRFMGPYRENFGGVCGGGRDFLQLKDQN